MLPRNPPCARLTGTIDAPKLEMRAMRSWLIQSGMNTVTGCPSARPTAEKAMPVLPLVASAIVSPGLIWPVRYACRRMCSAIRSLMLPVMLTCSYLA